MGSRVLYRARRCRPCPVGQESNEATDACRCMSGYFNTLRSVKCHQIDYSITAQSPSACGELSTLNQRMQTQCVEEAKGDVLQIADGWNMMNRVDGSVSVFACQIEGACPGITAVAGVNQTVCATGYDGILCGLCADDYAMAGDGTCGKCSELTVLGVIIVILGVSILIALLTQVKKWCANHPCLAPTFIENTGPFPRNLYCIASNGLALPPSYGRRPLPNTPTHTHTPSTHKVFYDTLTPAVI